jgi:hypothetical protein
MLKDFLQTLQTKHGLDILGKASHCDSKHLWLVSLLLTDSQKTIKPMETEIIEQHIGRGENTFPSATSPPKIII